MHLEGNKILPATPAPAVELLTNTSNAEGQVVGEHSVLDCETTTSNLRTVSVQKDQDDEEVLPHVKVKVEPTEDSQVATASAAASHRKGRTHSSEVIDLLDSGDEAPLPKKIKIEAFQDAKSSRPTSKACNRTTDVTTYAAVKTEPQEEGGELRVSKMLLSEKEHIKKSKKKSRLMLELEEIRIRKELQALEDEEDD